MFNDKFSQKHQKLLLWLFNTSLGRWFFKIDGNKSSVGKRKIIQILPHAITWRSRGRKLTTEFRTHDKFTKRLYYGLLPLWKLLHLWDTLVANIFNPAWNLGFDTLTAYPDVGTGATTCDANLQYTTGASSTWATAHDATAATAIVPTASLESIIDAQEVVGTTDQFQIVRGGFGFDLTSIAGATDVTATLSYWPTTTYSTAAGNANITLFSPATNNSFVVEDYDQFGVQKYSDDVLVSGITTGQYLDFVFNATGLANLLPGAINNFGTREATFDIANSSVGANSRCGIDGYYADQTGTDNDPKLVVTYTPGRGRLDLTSKMW